MKTRGFILGLAVAITLFTACNKDILEDTSMVTEEKSFVWEEDCTDSIFTTTAEDLTETDIEGLQFMREEEQLAHDVYTYFFELYGLTIFDRIAVSESKHSEAIVALLNHFELEDPSTGEAGIYSNETLQALYNDLIAMGEESVEAALNAGALIEETDIVDLDEEIAATENADIITIYSNLLTGSYMHIKGFVRNLETAGIIYEPVLLEQERYEEILALSGNRRGTNGNKGGSGNDSGNSGENGNGGNGNDGNQGGSGNGGNGNGGNQGGNGNGGNGNGGNQGGNGNGDGTGTCIN